MFRRGLLRARALAAAAADAGGSGSGASSGSNRFHSGGSASSGAGAQPSAAASLAASRGPAGRPPTDAALAVGTMLTAGAAACGAALALLLRPTAEQEAAPPEGTLRPDLPVYTREQVRQHTSAAGGGIWVTYRGGVYDVTDFVANHPGGKEKIMMAAGTSVEPYWLLYQQHLRSPAVREQLELRLIGRLDPKEAAAEAAAAAAANASDPYAADPPPHPAMAETPSSLLTHAWITPNDLWFIRSHHPVPALSAATHRVAVRGAAATAPLQLSVAELRARFPRRTVTASLQCGGNRRSHMDAVEKTSGISWGPGAISTAEWAGASLRDVLAAAGVNPDAPEEAGVHHIFHGADGMQASIPAHKAFSARGDVLIAYEMNGEPIPPHHGAPLRAVVPGVVGVRNVKWLSSIELSAEEATGPWQRSMAYKGLPPGLRSVEGVDIERVPSVQEQPVNSAITEPAAGAALALDPAAPVVAARGYAYSGGGRGIVRVDVSGDGGKTWTTALLLDGAQQPLNAAWAWTLWEAEVAVPPEALAAGAVELVCKATDAAYNVQPESIQGIWNMRGLNTNAWHRVRLAVTAAEE